MNTNELREDRANSILNYYSTTEEYYAARVLDGESSETDWPQEKYKVFNDLITLHHEELEIVTGFVSSTTGYLPAEEGDAFDSPPTKWWENAQVSNTQASMFYSDSNQLTADDMLYAGNILSVPSQRHPYSYWNQYHVIFGTDDDFGHVNAASSATYDNDNNPFLVTAGVKQYILREPLENYGFDNNLLWGRLAYNGKWAYRSGYCGDTDYTTVSDTGFYDYTTPGAGKSIGNLINTFVVTTNEWPSPLEIMRYTYWGTGSQGSLISPTITLHSGTSSGTFNSTGALTLDKWYLIYSTSVTSEGWIIHITDTASAPTYSYNGSHWPVPTSGSFNGTRATRIDPVISETEKQTPATNGRKNVWDAIYDQYFTGNSPYPSKGNSTFKTAVDGVTTQVTAWSSALSDIDSFDYTLVNSIATTQNIGKSQAATMKSNIDTWLAAWKLLINDSGSGSAYTINDSDWGDSALDALLTNATGGLNSLIVFSGDVYNGTQSGYISSRRTEIHSSAILGVYSKAANEKWNPADSTEFLENNTGSFTTDRLYAHRYSFISERINRNDGTLTVAKSNYDTSQDALTTVSDLETALFGNEFDVTPVDFELSKDDTDTITVDWEDTLAAACYRIERKVGGGSFSVIYAQYDYEDPGDPPGIDFSHVPLSLLEDEAMTSGYQEFGLAESDPTNSTGLNNDFTIYDFNIAVNGGTITNVEIKGLEAQTFETLTETIQNELNDLEFDTTITIEENATYDIRITSNLLGSTSAIAITAGTTNDLIAEISSGLDSAEPGITTLEPGKVYYYKIRVNNGKGETLGGGAENDKDWDSQSDWQLASYLNDKATHGDVGYVLWNSPEDLAASGVDEGISESELHCRLEWTTDSNAASYNIYRSLTLDGTYSYLSNTSSTYYEDTTGIAGLVYYYKIESVAGADQKDYDSNDTFTSPIKSLLTDEGVKGKKLWIGPFLTASDDDTDDITLTWTTVTGATGYLLYTAPIEDGRYSMLSEDDATELILTGNSYVDARPAKQIFKREFTSTTDGLAESEYTADTQYYFQIHTVNATTFLAELEEYWITSPNSGIWECQSITNSIRIAIESGFNNSICDLLLMNNPVVHYLIRISSKAPGTNSSIEIRNGSLTPSLLDILEVIPPEPGDGSYMGVNKYYKMQAIEAVSSSNEIVRYSGYSNTVAGFRPLDIPTSDS